MILCFVNTVLFPGLQRAAAKPSSLMRLHSDNQRLKTLRRLDHVQGIFPGLDHVVGRRGLKETNQQIGWANGADESKRDPDGKPRRGEVVETVGTWTADKDDEAGDLSESFPTAKNDSQQISDIIEQIIMEEAESVRLQNDGRLIEESWRMVELFQKDPAQYLASGFHLKLDKDGRLLATTALPFWKVDLAGTMRSFAAAAARKQFGLDLQQPTPLRIVNGKGGIEIGYSPLPQRAAFSVGWKDTVVTVTTGRPKLIRIPVRNSKRGFDTTPARGNNISVDVKSGTNKVATFYDSDDKVYGQKLSIGDLGVRLRHDFEGDVSAPTNVTVSYKDRGMTVEADPPELAYGVSIFGPKGRLEASRDSDDRRIHLKGQLDDFTVMWENDAKDEKSRAVSAKLEVGSQKAGALVSGGAERGDNGEVGGSVGFKAKDTDFSLGFQEDRLDGSLKLGTIKYKIQLRGGLPDFIVVS
ncbi:hypothetical protein BESB_009130 [Besnoitia besnoiti]|uniref:Uncharacterized protein n=1 Tax=Besnoitia besnoiti TaxID=94643 RepID=A0A2A9MPG5_BESBE|nr:hypothetical protein BESB_009130 [Besnoitia besnoiti]PFH38571.1 hypothetical protein BESB_009130 [Besnoitia besnoiti]